MSLPQDQVSYSLTKGVDTGVLTTTEQSIYNSNGFCATTCSGEYAYAVIIGQSCYCSNDVPATQVSTDECHDPCPGYPPDFCGNTTAGYYAYFNLGRAASATIQLSTTVNGSTTATSSLTSTNTSASPAVSSSTGSSTGTGSSIVSIQQYIQSALSTQSGPDATDGCFLNAGNTLYTSPSWYQHAPTQVQSYFSSTHQNTSATCAALANTLFASHSHHGLSSGAKAGIIVGSILGALLIAGIVILAFLCLRRRRRRSLQENGNMDEKMGETPEGVAGARMPSHLDDEHRPEHDLNDHSIVHGGVIDHHQPLHHQEATVAPSSATPAFTERRPSSPLGYPSRTAMAAAALAWGRQHRHDSSTLQVPANADNSVSESRASSVYETPTEAPQPPEMSSATHNGQGGTRPEPPGRTNTAHRSYKLDQSNPYHVPVVPGTSAVAQNERTIPRKPVGSSKNGLNNDRDGEQLTALPVRAGQRESGGYTFYDESADDDYPFHAR